MTYKNLQKSKPIIDYDFYIKKTQEEKIGKKVVLIYKNYKILPYRPGGIKIVRASDNKKLFILLIILKEYFNGGEKIYQH